MTRRDEKKRLGDLDKLLADPKADETAAKEQGEVARRFNDRLTAKEGDFTIDKKTTGKTLAEMDEEYAEQGGEPLIESDGPTVHVYLPEEE